MVLGRVSRRWGHMLSVVQLAPGRLRAQTPSGGSGPRTAAALRTLPREQLRVRAGVGKPPPPPGATPFFDGRAYGPPLCGGTPPATPPSTPCHVGPAAPASCLCRRSLTHVVPPSRPPRPRKVQALRQPSAPNQHTLRQGQALCLPCPPTNGQSPPSPERLRAQKKWIAGTSPLSTN